MNPEQLFNQNFAAIQAAKQQTGDWEKAYQQVTGTAWPKGQHITVSEDGGHMEKDKSKWKMAANLALTAAPIVAAPFTGGASMAALLGAGTGAAKSALNGGGWKGALKGGVMGAATGYGASKLGGILNGKLGGTGVGTPPIVGNSPGGGNAIADLMKKANVPMGKLIPNVNATSQSGGGGGSWWQKALGAGKKLIGGGSGDDGGDGGGSQGWADASSMLGAYGQSELMNRAMRGSMMQGYDELNLGFDKQNLARESDSMKKLAQTAYLKSGGAKPLPTMGASGAIPDFGFGPRPSSAAQMQGASTLEGSLLKRLTPEGQLKPTDPNTYTKEGVGEKIGKYGGLLTGGLGAAKTIGGW